ncbi:glycosyltransferase family 2 protein [Cereibacter sphaeroides]|uniref:glycosyltransferase family 2 protein n=1 Tax=Cereibacter sphaeroides TaxID=1063 RepID=UPI001F284ABE|nr:glycosyltransferase family 2 protein [Cereibacter sphaeroides]MCE6968663.1 glycosyltransferase family 2 protein [Cereibacter sphaeroides]
MAIATVVTSMKDEAPYVLEWVAYHRSIGFDRIVVLANDCTDGTDEILTRLHEMGAIAYYRNIVPLGAKPHSHALKLANVTPEVRSADYVMVFDADEFLVIKAKPHSVGMLLDAMEARGTGMMVIPWRIFGSSRNYTFEDRPVIERFRTSMSIANLPNKGVKTLFRQHEALRLAIHFPKVIRKNGRSVADAADFRWTDPDGNPMAPGRLSWNGGKNVVRRDAAEVAHFMIKSLDEYILKIFRGDGLMNSSRHGIDYWRGADCNEAEDLAVADCAPHFAAELARLRADPELTRLHDAAVAMRKARLEGLMLNEATVRLKRILKDSTEGVLQPAQIEESRRIVTALSPAWVPGSALAEEVPQSILLSVTTVGLPDSGALVAAVAGACLKRHAMFVHERDFAKRPISLLIQAIGKAQKAGRPHHLAVRHFPDYARRVPGPDWPVSEEISVVLTRGRASVLAGLPQRVAEPQPKQTARRLNDDGPLRRALTGHETLAEVEALVAAGRIEDPLLRCDRFVQENPGTLVLDLDEPDRCRDDLGRLAAGGSGHEAAARLLAEALGLDLGAGGAPRDRPEGLPPAGGPRKAHARTLRMFWFRRGAAARSGNFGDELSPLVVARLTGRSIEWADGGACDLAGIGSILSQVSKEATRAKRRDELLVWGSGLLEDDIAQLSPCIRPLAVRGVHTREALGLPEGLTLGDPGIFACELVPAAPKAHRWGIVPHFTHRKDPAVRRAAQARDCLLIDPTHPPAEVLRAISSCEAIVSSSLHGLIVADSYGVPGCWLNLRSHKSHEFKFHDYCSGLGRPMFRQAGPEDLPALVAGDPDVRAVPVPEECREGLRQALLTALDV